MSSAESELPASERRELLKEVYGRAKICTRCPELAATRKTVVFGAGNADADLMFVGEAPGASEDEQGVPFVGRAGKLLETLLGEIGIERKDVFIANVLKCLRYNALVQLGDGSWERVGRLVRSRYEGDVMSVDESGALVRKRVVGWHATPLGERGVYSLTYRSNKKAGRGRVGVQLTGDHPVLTERGFVSVEKLQKGDRVATGQGMSQLARDVVCGTVLGDGCLQASSSCLTFTHSHRQRDYARFKASLLMEFGVDVQERTVAAVVGGDRVYDVVQTRTLAHRALRVLRSDFYERRKVVPAWIVDELNPRMLAFWFMDDGYTRIRAGGRRPLAEIATNAFSDTDLQRLIAALQRLGLVAKASRSRLYFDVPTTERLCELIAAYVPPSMRYKLHPDVAARIPFDADLLELGATVSMYDEVEVEDITDRKRHDTTFFCLDVEGTHNFVTAGGVVHNCRPPGNRDPLPIEIENCQEYLLRQVELIQPTVICTLGNFSTKLLRGDPTGITRLHGQPEVLTLGRRAVRLYPIFHPAAALYTPRMLETLREDFARLPELLALGAPEQPPQAPELADAPEPQQAPEPAGPPDAAVQGTQSAEVDQLGLF
ncbi:MAG TPA: uracil-DNA glycosylase family protein [Solirubrobacteraceae bacterium]|nr:uracil-DNA glycosylase family protein [Solirubrobacteraceae bacterium]